MESVYAASSYAVSSSVTSFLNGFSVLLNHVPIVVPQADRRFRQVVFVAQDAQRRGGEHEEAGLVSRQAQPARRQDPQKVAVTEQEDVPVDGPQSGYHPVGTGPDRRHRLATGTAVAEEIPVGPLAADVGGAPALIVAVIPLLQIRDDLAGVAKARQLARPAGPPQRAHEDLGKSHAVEPLTQAHGVVLTVRRERDIRPARVLTGERPGRLTMPCQVDLRQRCLHNASFDA